MIHNRSKGSIVGFVIVGVLLLGLIAGTVYALRRGVFNGTSQPAQIARNTPAEENKNSSDSTNTNSVTSTAEQKTDELSIALKKQAEAEKRAKEQNQAASGSATNSSGSNSQNQTPGSIASSNSSSSAATSNSAHLPTTGPTEDALLAAAGLGAVACLAVAYHRSRALV